MKKPRILLYDLETSPNLGYTWGKYETNVIAFKKEWQILSFAYKWLGEKDVYCLTAEGASSDKKLVTELKKLWNQADIVIAHKGDSFDQKKTRARMIYHNITPPQQVVSIDTLLVAKRYFAFTGNGLDDLGAHLGLGRKEKHPGFDMWLGCMSGDAKAWHQMAKYNKQDVLLLEKVYKRFLPWITNHPSIARILGNDSLSACPNCGSVDTTKFGFRFTNRQKQQRWECGGCGTTFTTKLEPKKKGGAKK